MPHSKALVTLAIGQSYLDKWQTLCQPNWQKYAERHGYDIICIDVPLDESDRAKSRSPAWQKCLILSQPFAEQYERLVWIDADILINAAIAPCVVSEVPAEQIGAVEMFSTPSRDSFVQATRRRAEFQASHNSQSTLTTELTATEYYTAYGLPATFDQVVQTGVLVLSPQHHRTILEKAYFDYEEKGSSEWNYEMRPLSYEILQAAQVHWLDPRFNLCWADYRYLYYPFLLSRPQPDLAFAAQPGLATALGAASRYQYTKLCATTAFLDSFFFHFAGCNGDMMLVDTSIEHWQDCTEERITAGMLEQLAGTSAERGQTEQAIALYQQSLNLQPPQHNLNGQAAVLQAIAELYANQGNGEQAIHFYQQAANLQQSLGDAQAQATSLTAIGQLSAMQGDFATALTTLQSALNLLTQIQSSDAEIVAEIVADLQHVMGQ